MNSYGSYLAHHGVLGMKWGVRHDKRKNSTNKHVKSTKSRQKYKMSEKAKTEIGRRFCLNMASVGMLAVSNQMATAAGAEWLKNFNYGAMAGNILAMPIEALIIMNKDKKG